MTLPIADILFYVFSALLLTGSLAAVTLRNPVHAVLTLIFVFFNAAALFLLIGAEYLAMTLVIVYVGAVAILFLFVVMMLDIKKTEARSSFVAFLPVGLLLALGFGYLFYTRLFQAALPQALPDPLHPLPDPTEISNAHAIGAVLYTDYFYLFQLSGLVLLVAMIGAIVLTLRHRKDVRRQKVLKQLSRTRRDGVALVDVPSHSGVDV